MICCLCSGLNKNIGHQIAFAGGNPLAVHVEKDVTGLEAVACVPSVG
jgi:hypothetical protein